MADHNLEAKSMKVGVFPAMDSPGA